MAHTLREVLLRALEDLGEKSFKRFRNKLLDWEIKEGFRKIPRIKLEKADTEDVVDLILNHFTDSYGPELVVAVLDAIDEKQLALDLKKDLENVTGGREKPKERQPTQETSSSSAPKPQVESFVDKHREALIDRCALVAPILDGLLSKSLLMTYQYDHILAEKAPQDQMRKLYTFIRGWSESNKHTLYEIIKEKNPCLVEDLEQS